MNIINKVARLQEPGKFIFTEETITELSSNQVLIKILTSGICSSEIPFYTGKAKADSKAFIKYANYPLDLGHEITGRVVETGCSVKHFKKGDYVTGITIYGSGFAEYFIENEENLVKIPININHEQVIGEPITCSMNILRSIEPEIGDNVVILGDGFMALLMVQLLSKFPLKSLTVIGLSEFKLNLASEFGASTLLYSDKVALELLHDRGLDKKGADIVIELAGNSAALETAAWLVKSHRGKLAIPSYYTKSENFSIGGYLMRKGPKLIPAHPAYSKNFNDDMHRGMWAVNKRIINLEKMITHRFSFNQIHEAFNFTSQKKPQCIKTVIKYEEQK
jgi:L-iditol 2-dehydrogenase